ncbi:hypothetical protein VCHENC02_1721A, partial [Vibrio harveyi]
MFFITCFSSLDLF